jgi:hypothetical protein
MQKVRAVVAVGGTFRPVPGTAAWEYTGDITYKVVGLPRSATYTELQALLANRAELDPSLSSSSIKVGPVRSICTAAPGYVVGMQHAFESPISDMLHG